MLVTDLKIIHGTDRNTQSGVREHFVSYIKRKVVSMKHMWIKLKTGLRIVLFHKSRNVFR